MAKRSPPDRPVALPVQRLRIRYAKRGPLRFSSHRDFQRALERALRRTAVPMAYSAGFSPHPKVSYANAAPTGCASEAEYVELAVVRECDPGALRRELDAALPAGLDILEVVVARTPDLIARLEASDWLIEFPGASRPSLAAALTDLLASEHVFVERMMKQGRRTLEIRPAIVHGALVHGALAHVPLVGGSTAAALQITVRNTTPTVRPEEIGSALRQFGLPAGAPTRATRLAQGPLDDGSLGDPLAPDRIGLTPANA